MFAGIMLFIGLTLGGYWQSPEPQAFLDWFATNNGFIQDTIPLVAIPTLIGAMICVALSWRQPSGRWWLGKGPDGWGGQMFAVTIDKIPGGVICHE